MKKLFKSIICAMIVCLCTTIINAQTLNLSVTEFEEGEVRGYCAEMYDSIRISKDPNCNTGILWRISYFPGGTWNNYSTDEVTFPFNSEYDEIVITYWGCGLNEFSFSILPLDFDNVPEPWPYDTTWLTLGETRTLYATYSQGLNYLWPNGSTNWTYTVTGPNNSGNIWVEMSNQCGSETDTIGAYYKAELEMVSVNPFTDHIELTWDVNPYMAGYLESIEIYRDNYLIATVPYIQGQYVDEGVYGSVTSRTYKCKSVSKKGYTSPFGSNKPSIHMVYLIDAFNRLVMEANDVSNYYDKLTQYYVALMQENGEMLIIDSISVNKGKIDNDTKNNVEVTRDGILRYTAGMEYINGSGFPVFIANLRDGNGKRGKQMYSNVGANEIVGLPEPINNGIKVYPNPTKDRVTIEGMGTAIITNALGQTILTKEIDGKATIELPRGMYFVKMKGVTRKIVVE